MSKRTSPAAQRNTAAIGDVLAEVLPPEGLVLEIASGSGEHAAAFARRFPGVTWQPTDRDAAALASIDAWAAEAELPNLLKARALDVTMWPWPVAEAAAVVAINLVHIAPWTACEALMRGAGAVLRAGSPLLLYGAMKVNGAFTSESNAAFDRSLRASDPAWGVRDLEAVAAEAQRSGLRLTRTVAMPANNFSLVFVREADRR
jgi:cyclopropane fatty-acyl-phospholipid synthase-like methyltransferase